MADGKGSTRRQEPSNGTGARGSKLPRLGQRRHQDEALSADADSPPGSRRNSQSSSPSHPTHDIHDIRSTPTREHRRTVSGSSITSQESIGSLSPRSSSRTNRTPNTKVRNLRISGDNPRSPRSYNAPPSPRDSVTAARAALRGPHISSHIPNPRLLGSRSSSPPRQSSRRKDSKPKDNSKMENIPENEKSAVAVSDVKETTDRQPLPAGTEKRVLNGETEAQSNASATLNGDGDKSAKDGHDTSGLEKGADSPEVNGLSTTNGDKAESNGQESNPDGDSYASALKSGLNGQDTYDLAAERNRNSHDDDDSYPELDDLTIEEIHVPPKPNANGGIRWAPWNVPLKRRMQTLVVLTHCMCIGLTVSFFFFLCANPFFWPLLLIYLLHALSSKASTDGSLKYRSEWFRRSYMWHLFAGYFPARLHKTHDLPPTRKYIFGYHPHGIISHGAWVAFATEALGFAEKFPGITNSLLTLDSNFRLPLYREYVLAAGVRSVSKESIVNILTKGGPNGEGMGRGVTIVIGGARESLEAYPGQMRLILKERKGFIKLAVRTGADLVPVLAFGENNLYDQLHPNDHPVVHKLQMFILKVWKFTLPFLHGRGIFNYDVGLMPYRRPLNVVVGAPIKVTQSATVEQAEINRLHDLYVAELEKLWDRYKDEFYPDRKEEMQILS
ncbi:diacylglycerol acyltransferase-domain-containing protein [Hypoxylon sp. FL1150]|nr:diacylglycerol acyltransferase-domain-containing protein [Hypoxylon sp. FL1150]